VTGPPGSPSTHLQVLPTPHQFTFQPERLGPVPHAGPPTYQDHEEKCQLTFLLLPFLLTTPSLLTSLTGLSLANSICPFPHLFSRKTSKNENFSPIPDFSYYLPKIPIIADIRSNIFGRIFLIYRHGVEEVR
jgi:hypothetical protein